MKLEDYFDFLAPDDIRIKGTRVGKMSACLSSIPHPTPTAAASHP